MNSFLKRTLGTTCDKSHPKRTIKNKKLEITSSNEAYRSGNWATISVNEGSTSAN